MIASTTSTLELIWIVQGLLGLSITILNYHLAWSDARLMRNSGRNGQLMLASDDQRQAELFRALAVGALTAGGLIAASLPGVSSGGPVSWIQFFLVVANTALGLSSIRSRINRARAIGYAMSPWVGRERRSDA